MILEKLKVLDIRKVGDTDEGIQAGISNESLPFIFELVSKQLYSNPIGSIIREITSNCFDSHIEAGVNQPVIITQSYSMEEGTAIEFKDIGVGISPDRMVDIYMNYFSSSKRDTNEQIGGFGIGSKTPLAYADMFYITTIHNGLKYEYLFHKGENKPTLESLLGYDEVEEEYEVSTEYNEDTNEFIELEEPIIKTRIVKVPIGNPTEEHNGTTIKINIESKDMATFKHELKFQLAYFDDVYFSNWGISNDYDIYEGKYFKFRSDIDQSNTKIHLCIGKVRYPIDINKVAIPSNILNIPIAVKFEIGELQITPSRENLRYNDKDIALISERVNLAVQEIIAIFDKQNPEIEDFNTFNKLMRDTAKITFNKEKGHGIYIWDNSGISKNYKFKPFSGLPFKKTPKNFFFLWECIGYIQNGTFKQYSSYNTSTIDNDFIVRNRDRFLILGREERTSEYTNICISESLMGQVYVIRRKRLNFKDAINQLGINKIRKKFGEKLDNLLKDIENKEKKEKAIETSKAKILHQFIKITDAIIYSEGVLYNDYRPTQDWINDYKRSIIERSAAYIRKKNNKVFIKDASISFSSREVKQLDLEKRTGILVYGFKEHREILGNIYRSIVDSYIPFRKITNTEKQRKAFLVIQIARDAEKLVVGAEKTMYWEDFLVSDFFAKVLTYYRLYQLWESISIADTNMKETYIKDFEEDYDKSYKSSHSKFRDEFYIPEKYLVDSLVNRFKFNEVNNFILKHSYEMPIFGYVNSSIKNNEIHNNHFIIYLKSIGVRLKNEFYLKTSKQLKEEQRHKDFISSTLQLIRAFKEPFKNNLLTFNQEENVNNNEETSNSEETGEESSSYQDYGTIQIEEDR